MKLPAIPYMGSKRSIAEDIVKMIRIKAPNAKYFYDVFGGGGAISVQALNQGFSVKYNEYETKIANLMKFLKDLKGKGLPKEWYNWITREEFEEIINSDRVDAYAGMVACCWSFGNKGADYIYGKTIEEKKRLCSELVINQSKKAQEILRKEHDIDFDIPQEHVIYDRYLKEYKPRLRELKKRLDRQRLQQLERLQQLQQLQRLERLERLETTNLDYMDIKIITPLHETVVYCDPPYRGTTKYVSGEFDFDSFDKWFKNLQCAGFLSEYNAPFKEILSIKKRSLLSAGGSSKIKLEKLYTNEKI